MKRIHPVFWLIAMLLLAALACNFVSGGDDPTAVPEAEETAVQVETPLPTPTNTPEPLPTEPPPTEAPPTEVPPTEAPPTEVPPTGAPEEPVADLLTLDDFSYEHYLRYFEIYPPSGWIMDEGEGGATFTAPDDSGFVEVEVTNTGEVLDGESFQRFVDAREDNYFGDYDEYEVVDYQIDPDFGVARVTKSFVDGVFPQHVFTYYDQYGSTIYAYDFWADSDVADAYGPAYEEILDTAFVDPDAVSESADLYYWIFTFYGPNDLFSIDVPLPWRHVTEEEVNVIVDTFYSPDEHGIIQNIAYDDGTEISRSDAGAFALELLKNSYASDIQVTDDQVQSDGSERLTWSSPGGAFSGISFLETRGTTFLLFSVLWDDAYEDAYLDTLTYVIESYDVPE